MKSKIIALAVILLAVLGIGYVFIFSKAQVSVVVPSQTSSSLQYKDGAYSVLGDYFSPGGHEELNVKVTIQKDIVSSADVSSSIASGPTAIRFQNIFINNFKYQVIGKNIHDVKLDRISGSSLTPQGWNDAISKIELQAKV